MTRVGVFAAAVIAAFVTATSAADMGRCADVCSGLGFPYFSAADDGACACGDTAPTSAEAKELGVQSCTKFSVERADGASANATLQVHSRTFAQWADVSPDDAAFLANFNKVALDSLNNAQAPSDYPALIDNNANIGYHIFSHVSGAADAAHLLQGAGVAQYCPVLLENLERDLPSMMLSHGAVLHSVYYEAATASMDQLCIMVAATQPSLASPDVMFAVEWLLLTVQQVQQRQLVHTCHGCWIFATCCEDDWVNVPDTPAQLADIKLGMTATVLEIWTKSPITSITTGADEEEGHQDAINQAAMHQAVQQVYDSRQRWYDPNTSDPLSLLDAEEKAFLNSAANQQKLQRNTSNPTVNSIKEELSSLASTASVTVLVGIYTDDIARVMDIVAPDADTATELKTGVAEFLKEAADSSGNTTDWFQIVDVHASEQSGNSTATFTYTSVFLFATNVTETGQVTEVDIVACSVVDALSLEELDISFTTRVLRNGTVVTDMAVTQLPKDMSTDDVHQFTVQLAFLAADAVVAALSEHDSTADKTAVGPRSEPSLHFRAYEFMRHQRAQDPFVGKGLGPDFETSASNFDGLLEGVKSTLSSILSAMGGFLRSTTQTAQVICPEGYSHLVTSSSVLTLQGVDTSTQGNIAEMCSAMVGSFGDDVVAKCVSNIMLQLLQHGSDPRTQWVQMDHKFNATDAVGNGDIYTVHVAPQTTPNDYHDFSWVVYSYSFDIAGAVELITTKSSWLGGIFTTTGDQEMTLPPVWTAADATAMIAFLEATMDNLVCQGLWVTGAPICSVPPFPPPGDADNGPGDDWYKVWLAFWRSD